MPSSHKPRFLLDENVHRKLYQYLKDNNFDLKLPEKGTIEKEVADISKSE